MAQLTSSTNHHTQSMSTRSHISIHLRTPRHICSIHHHPQKNLTNTIIVTDSKSAITAIQHTTTKLTHPLIHYILQQHTDLAPQAQPTLLWIPGHCGVQGNTQADHAAKQALSHTTTSNVPLHTTQTSTPFSDQHYTNICNIHGTTLKHTYNASTQSLNTGTPLTSTADQMSEPSHVSE